jgi:tetrahydromethanopterin S-methyltransferase subunit C
VAVAAVALAALLCILVGFDITRLVVGPIVFVALTFVIGAVLARLTAVVFRHRQE